MFLKSSEQLCISFDHLFLQGIFTAICVANLFFLSSKSVFLGFYFVLLKQDSGNSHASWHKSSLVNRRCRMNAKRSNQEKNSFLGSEESGSVPSIWSIRLEQV